ncbi:PAS domain S-box protein [Bacillus sp. HMF5848]|uniref:ATP-binding protein n=1 Tax=Bacillus sp. HMF5848 TaxID=2495421 RepID=UPI000F7AFE7B|nr:ATP-binding protein [Bacillus sp. HMF5848]RSK26647.1 PAS domain S-box protein [Bacillus sp. HMF5848]
MQNELHIRQRNKLLLILLSVFYIFDTGVFYILDPDITTLWPPVGLVVAIALFLLNISKTPAIFNMYASITGVYIFFFVLNIMHINFINYIFIIFGIIVSSIYQRIGPLVYSSIICCVLLVYFHNKNFHLYGTYFEAFDVIYYVLFALFTLVFFIFHTRYVNQLWENLQQEEADTKKELFNTQEQLQSLFKYTEDGIVILDTIGTIMNANDAFAKLYGYRLNDIIGKVHPIIPDDQLEKVQKRLKTVLSGESIVAFETKEIKKDGTYFDAEVTLSPIFNKHKDIVAISGIVRNISEKKQTEKILRQSEKLKLAGEMAAGIAHEIRNPLTVISGFIQMIHNEDSKHRTYTRIIDTELKRINQIISEFLILAKPQANIKKQVSLQNILHNVHILFESECHLRNIRLIMDLPEKPLTISAEPNQLKQVFINLIKNGMEAMPDGGDIIIQLEIDTTNKYYIVTITDTGCGIPKDILEIIKTPFYTTKEEGTGLGLVITEKIIQDHKGELEIVSELNKGTTIRISLPAN